MVVIKKVFSGRLNEYANIINSGQRTSHLVERHERVRKYKELGLLSTNFIDGFVVDKDHDNGVELHLINNNGLIYIMNARTKKLITVLGARPMQIQRYYNDLGLPINAGVQAIINRAGQNVNKYNINAF